MSKISVIIILLLQAGTSVAQNYFVFIGSDNRQPFYVRVDSQFNSSSAEGHLILSQLKDSTYNITIGFPGQTQPEQHYTFSIQGRDQAFELRSRDPGDLRLYDLQNSQWLSPQGGGEGSDARSPGIKKDDAFSRLMAGVVRDTAVLYNTYAMERALSDSPAVAASQSAPGTSQPGSAVQSAPAQSTPALTPAGTQSATTQSAPPDTATTNPTASATVGTNLTAATTNPPTATTNPVAPTTPSSDSTAFKPIDSANSATSLSNSPNRATSAPTDSFSRSISADTSAILPAGTITHQPAARFNDSGATTSLYRTIPKDSTAAAAPIPSTVGAPLYRKVPTVTKLSERHTQKNVRLVYTDRSGSNKADTIVVIIPVDSPAMAKTAGRQPPAGDSNHLPAARAHGPNADSPAMSSVAYRATIPPTAPTEAPRPHPADSSHKPGKTVAFINSDCHDFATDFDVDKLRIRMLQSVKEDDQIALARKTFKVKCFYTRQIRALSEVFATDAAKFRFFEAAWPFAADDHFNELANLLTDPVYSGKFKTMTHQQ